MGGTENAPCAEGQKTVRQRIEQGTDGPMRLGLLGPYWAPTAHGHGWTSSRLCINPGDFFHTLGSTVKPQSHPEHLFAVSQAFSSNICG